MLEYFAAGLKWFHGTGAVYRAGQALRRRRAAVPPEGDVGGRFDGAPDVGEGDRGPPFERLGDAGEHPDHFAVQFDVRNAGSIPHALKIQAAGGGTVSTATISPGKSATLTAKLTKGTYVWFCPIDGHRGLGMKGTITVAGGGSGGSVSPGSGAPAPSPGTGGGGGGY